MKMEKVRMMMMMMVRRRMVVVKMRLKLLSRP